MTCTTHGALFDMSDNFAEYNYSIIIYYMKVAEMFHIMLMLNHHAWTKS